jgi:hypothetical protein
MISKLAIDKSTKGVILEILTKEFPLSAKQVHSRVNRFGNKMSYHGVYSSLSEMVDNSIIIKTGSNYELSRKWINDTSFAIERLKTKHTISPILSDLKQGEVRKINFNSYKEYVAFTRKYTNHFIENIDSKKKNRIFWLVYHATRGIYNTDTNAEFAKTLEEKKISFYIAVSGDTAMDKISKVVCEQMNMKNMKLGIPNNFGMSISIYNDVAICAIFPHGIKKQLENLYKESNKIGGDIFKVLEHMTKISNYLNSLDQPIKVLVVKNPDLVETYQDYILSFFQKDGSGLV